MVCKARFAEEAQLRAHLEAECERTGCGKHESRFVAPLVRGAGTPYTRLVHMPLRGEECDTGPHGDHRTERSKSKPNTDVGAQRDQGGVKGEPEEID